MTKFTSDRKSVALDVLEKYTRELHDSRSFNVVRLELALRDIWNIGYQSLKGIMIDMVENHSQYEHLAAYYMENINPAGVVVEFQRPLANLYGISAFHDKTKDKKRGEYWSNAFAVISQFDLDEVREGQTILQVSTEVGTKLIEYFLRHPEKMRKIPPRDFEELVAELFDGFGYSVELTKSTRDGGIDIIAIGNSDVSNSKYLIECKRYSESNKVSIHSVRSLYGVVKDEGATKGIIVTTSYFTKPAQQFFERNKWILEGRDFDDLVFWLHNYQKLKFGSRLDA